MSYAMYPLVELFWIVGFGLFTPATTSERSLRKTSMAMPGYGIQAVQQSYEVANVQCSVNDVNVIELFETYRFRSREVDYAQRHDGESRTQEVEEVYQGRKAALAKLNDNTKCPVDGCETVLTPDSRIFNKGLMQFLCAPRLRKDGNDAARKAAPERH